MDFSLDPDTHALVRRIEAFVRDRIIPLEDVASSYDEHENLRLDLLETLRAEAKAEGLFSLQLPRAIGGGGLTKVQMVACYEAMNHSIFGPVVFNSAAPDDGTMMLLAQIATPAQRERVLMPLARGECRSAFAMTEPAPGAGSDPAMMRTTARRDGDGWVIEGRKWFTTGADGATHFVVLAKTSDDPRKGLTAFLFHKDDPGFRIVRRIPILGPEEHGGHCELEFTGLRVPDENRLLGVGDGLKVTQIRLGPARLTHCMRWSGLSRRALSIASEYVRTRHSHGQRLADREGVQWMLGEAAMAVDVGRLLTMRAAYLLDQGSFARKEISMAKVAVSEALHRAVDTSIQLCGARGYSKDTLLEWMYRYARQARLVDGASEVHKMVLARHVLDEGDGFFSIPEAKSTDV